MDPIRDVLFRDMERLRFRAQLTAADAGVLSGVETALRCAGEIGVSLSLPGKEGDALYPGDVIAVFEASPSVVALAEERLVGSLAKFSGIATAARRAVDLAGGRARIVSGAWKKMPSGIKDGVRRAVASGGAGFRICEGGMVYLDKNYIRMRGSIAAALKATESLAPLTRVVQIKGRDASIEEETAQALEYGCGLLMVDTGDTGDLERCLRVVCGKGMRGSVQVAFANGVRVSDVPRLSRLDVDIICIGRDIVDAPLLDLQLDVIGREREHAAEFAGKNRAVGSPHPA